MRLAEESGLPRPTMTNHFAFERLDPRVLAIVEAAVDRSHFGVAAAQLFATVPADQMDLAVELARQVAEGVLTTAGAAAELKPRTELAKSKPIQVRHGSQVTCSIQRKGVNIIVAVKDESFMDDELLDAIKFLLQERSKTKAGSA